MGYEKECANRLVETMKGSAQPKRPRADQLLDSISRINFIVDDLDRLLAELDGADIDEPNCKPPMPPASVRFVLHEGYQHIDDAVNAARARIQNLREVLL